MGVMVEGRDIVDHIEIVLVELLHVGTGIRAGLSERERGCQAENESGNESNSCHNSFQRLKALLITDRFGIARAMP
jgi:hypothetical protein